MSPASASPLLQPLTICPLSRDLVPAAIALDQQCLGGMWSREGYEREIDSPNSDLFMLVGEPSSTQLAPPPLLGLGCTWAIVEEAHITLLAIAPPYQRQGLGQVMLYTLLTAAVERGLERATLEVRASNRGAIALYQQFGFTLVGPRPKYYADGEDALILWRSGLHRPDFRRWLAQQSQPIQQRLAQSQWAWPSTISPTSRDRPTAIALPRSRLGSSS